MSEVIKRVTSLKTTIGRFETINLFRGGNRVRYLVPLLWQGVVDFVVHVEVDSLRLKSAVCLSAREGCRVRHCFASDFCILFGVEELLIESSLPADCGLRASIAACFCIGRVVALHEEQVVVCARRLLGFGVVGVLLLLPLTFLSLFVALDRRAIVLRTLIFVDLFKHIHFVGLGCTTHPTPRARVAYILEFVGVWYLVLVYLFLGLFGCFGLELAYVVFSLPQDLLCQRNGSFPCC